LSSLLVLVVVVRQQTGPRPNSPSRATCGTGRTKRARAMTSIVVADDEKRRDQEEVMEVEPGRTSRLAAPTMKLTGHSGEVYAARFSPTGELLASCAHDKDVFLWEVFTPECRNTLVLKGHTAPVLDVAWTCNGGGHLASASADKHVLLFDVEAGDRERKFAGHRAIVNAVCTSRRSVSVVASGSNDRTARVWDARAGSRERPLTIAHPFQVTSVALSTDDTTLFTGSIDNDIRAWDLRMVVAATDDDEEDGTAGSIGVKLKMTLEGHKDSVTGISLSNDGNFLLSNAMDNALRVWDVRPYFRGATTRCVKVLGGHVHTFEKTLLRCAWSRDNQLVAAGSGDGFVNIWSTTSRQILYKLPGHAGSVNDVQFHPIDPVIASCGADKAIFLGEIAKW
jgi:Prp8 binding protein